MTKILPNSDQDLTNAYLYLELQRKGLDHTQILAKLIESTGAYSRDIGDHVNSVRADQDEFIKNRYSNPNEKHDIDQLQKDLGPIPALKKFKNFFHSVVEMLDDGSFEIDLFKTKEDYEGKKDKKGAPIDPDFVRHPTEIINLTPMLELDVAASVKEDDMIVAAVKDEMRLLPYISLSDLILAHNDLELTDEETDEYTRVVHQAHGEMYDEACEGIDDTAEAVHPSKKGQKEPKLQKIKTSDLDDLAAITGTGITKHEIRDAEGSGLSQEVVEAVEKALVAAGNRNFQKWSAKRGKEEGVKWGKAAESHAEFANYVTSNYMVGAADELLETLLVKDMADAEDAQSAYKEALNFFDRDIVNFIKKTGPAAYQEGVEKWYKTLWDEGPSAGDDEFATKEDYAMEEEAA